MAISLLSSAVSITALVAAGAASADQPLGPASTTAPGTQVDSEDESTLAAAAVQAAGGREIVVVAQRLVGQVETEQPPILVLDEEEIGSYGASDIQDLLTTLAPQTGSGRGRGGAPVVLLNGQRISSFREMRSIPTEAIRRVEVLPEEVALQYGFSADQRVVNFILKQQFAALTTEGEYRFPGSGGYDGGEIQASLFSIAGKSRYNLTGTITDASPLTEAERNILQPAASAAVVAGDPDAAAFRTLLPDTRSVQVNGSFARPLGQATGISLNAAAEKADTRSLFGLNGVTVTAPGGAPVSRTFLFPGPLTREGTTTTLSAGGALNHQFGEGWRLNVTGDYSHAESTTRTDRRADAGAVRDLVAAGLLSPDAVLPTVAIGTVAADRARSDSDTLTTLATVSGSPLSLPAGSVSLTAKAGYDFRGIESSDTRNPGLLTDLTRHEGQAGFNLQLPIASRREDVLAGIGDLSINLNGDLNELSDFGTLVGYGAGLTWSPTEKLGIQASYIAREAAPSLANLGGPVLLTPNATVFDFTRGETVLVNVLSGGNPDLLKERQRDLKIGVNWQLPFMERSNFVAEYFRNRSSDTTNNFPLLTPSVEAAFPGRVTRDSAGRLVAIDQRPVTFAEERGERFRYGVNLSGAFGAAAPAAQSDGGPGGPGGIGGPRGAGGGGPRAGGPGGPGRGGMGGPGRGGPGRGGPGMGGGGDGRGRWNLSVYHTVRLEESVLIADGGPILDLLDGDALSGGGVARHGFEFEGGAFYRGFGLRLSGNYTGGSRIEGTGLPGSTTLRFAPIARFDLRAFANLGQQESLVRAVPFLKNSRVSLRINNLFDAQQRVTDPTGAVPLRYQPGFLDPAGRLFEIELRKQF